MKKVKVYITGFEGNEQSAISGWSWFYNKKDANADYKQVKEGIKPTPLATAYRGEIVVEVPDNIKLYTEEAQEEINGQVELFLCENDFDNAFKSNQ